MAEFNIPFLLALFSADLACSHYMGVIADHAGKVPYTVAAQLALNYVIRFF